MSRGPDPRRPIEAVQNAAVEHAVTVGESRDALALVGALEPPSRPQSRESLAVPSMTTAAVLTAWFGLRQRSDRNGQVTGPATGTPEPPGLGDGIGDGGDPSPAAIGAAVACERFELSPASAASLADCGVSAVRQVLAERADADASSNDPRHDR